MSKHIFCSKMCIKITQVQKGIFRSVGVNHLIVGVDFASSR